VSAVVDVSSGLFGLKLAKSLVADAQSVCGDLVEPPNHTLF